MRAVFELCSREKNGPTPTWRRDMLAHAKGDYGIPNCGSRRAKSLFPVFLQTVFAMRRRSELSSSTIWIDSAGAPLPRQRALSIGRPNSHRGHQFVTTTNFRKERLKMNFGDSLTWKLLKICTITSASKPCVSSAPALDFSQVGIIA